MAKENNNVEKKSDKVVKVKKSDKKKPNMFKRIWNYFKESKSELKKVVWPSPKQLVNNTLIVLGVMVVSAIFVGIIDAIVVKIMELIV